MRAKIAPVRARKLPVKIPSPGRRLIPGGSIPNPARSVKMPKAKSVGSRRDYGKQLDPMGYQNVGFGETGETGET